MLAGTLIASITVFSGGGTAISTENVVFPSKSDTQSLQLDYYFVQFPICVVLF